ncbi:hypothetical protein D3C80_2057060 [compost metagenome]
MNRLSCSRAWIMAALSVRPVTASHRAGQNCASTQVCSTNRWLGSSSLARTSSPRYSLSAGVAPLKALMNADGSSWRLSDKVAR